VSKICVVRDVAEKLPDTVEALRVLVLRRNAELEEREAELEARDAEIAQLREYVRLLRHQRFGRKSEKVSPDQLSIFNEAEREVAEAASREKERDEIQVPAHTRKKGGRRPLPESLPCIEVVHDLPDAEKVCARDGTRLVEIGREESEQLEIIPAKLRRVRHIRPKYGCPTCKEGVKVAPVPPQPIPKSIASPALLAHVATQKFVDGMPLYRQEVDPGLLDGEGRAPFPTLDQSDPRRHPGHGLRAGGRDPLPSAEGTGAKGDEPFVPLGAAGGGPGSAGRPVSLRPLP
jgi:transposase